MHGLSEQKSHVINASPCFDQSKQRKKNVNVERSRRVYDRYCWQITCVNFTKRSKRSRYVYNLVYKWTWWRRPRRLFIFASSVRIRKYNREYVYTRTYVALIPSRSTNNQKTLASTSEREKGKWVSTARTDVINYVRLITANCHVDPDFTLAHFSIR